MTSSTNKREEVARINNKIRPKKINFNLETYKKKVEAYKKQIADIKEEKFDFKPKESKINIEVKEVKKKFVPGTDFYKNKEIVNLIYGHTDLDIDFALINFLSMMCEKGCTTKRGIVLVFKSESKENKEVVKEHTLMDLDLIVKTNCNIKKGEEYKVSLRSYCKYLSKRYKHLIDQEIEKKKDNRKFFKEFNLSYLYPDSPEYMTDAFAKIVVPSDKYEMMKMYLTGYSIQDAYSKNNANAKFVEFKKKMTSLTRELCQNIESFPYDCGHKECVGQLETIIAIESQKNIKEEDKEVIVQKEGKDPVIVKQAKHYLKTFDMIHYIRTAKTIQSKKDFFMKLNTFISNIITQNYGIQLAAKKITTMSICVYLHDELDIDDISEMSEDNKNNINDNTNVEKNLNNNE